MTLPAEAQRFLNLLDPTAERFTFQTFQDLPQSTPVTKPELARVLQSTRHLQEFHEAGAGIYVCINATDLKGRKSENIVRVRAIWQEADTGYDGPFPLPPSIEVESSPGHAHRYWLTSWPADQQGRADHATVMERMIADYGSCPGAKDISRVLRVPGFLHRKGKPHLVRILAALGHRYTRQEILAAFPPLPRKQQHKPVTWQSRHDDDERIAAALRTIPADDRRTWIEVGMALKVHLGEAGKALWDRWSRTSTKYDKRELERQWRSFKKSGITINTLFHHALAAGWRPPQISEAERTAWSAAGTFIAMLEHEDAYDSFLAWCKRNPVISRPRAEWVFQTILNKELGQ
jgi:hypothetical protein